MKGNILYIFLILLGGCAPSVPHMKKKEVDVELPKEFPNTKGEQEKEPTSLKKWQQYFKDPILLNLIDEALQKNQELNILDEEIKIASNEVMSREGEYIPNLNFKSGYESEKVGEFTSQGISDKSHTYEEGKEVGEVLHNHKVGLYTSWEIDIWGKLRNASKAAYYRFLGSQEAKKLATTNLISELAMSYYELIALDQNLEIINENVEILMRAQKLVKAQQSAARVTSLAVQRFNAEVLKNQAKLYDIKQQRYIVENRINILVGRFPQHIKRGAIKLEDLVPLEVFHGIPTSLLDNRPDVKQAALELKAAELDVKATKARFYPALSFEAGAGYEAFNKDHLGDNPQSIFWNLGVNLTAPLLNRSAIKADYYSANNAQVQAIFNYEKILITAFTEVTNQVNTIDNLTKKLTAKKEQMEALKNSVEISAVLFKAARVDYVEALLTRRESLEAQVEYIESNLEQLSSVVKLYKALGGGWQ